ncbi:MAG: hypothetical protein KAJ97_11610 [Acidobacteria bacterium]|nr:hypothetical protein [Acidobacteriota bacterium]
MIAAGAGLSIGRLARADQLQQRALVFEFACRKIAITMLVGLTALHRAENAIRGACMAKNRPS